MKLKIIGLKADGFKKLNAVEMKFQENGFTIIKGCNKQGKTSVLDCIEYLFKGKVKINSDTLGKEKSEINAELDLGKYTIKRIQDEKKDRLEIRNKEGFKINEKPQALLDTFINELTFNPFPFINKTPKEKLRFMMDFLKIDFSEIDNKIEKAEEERLYIGRKGKELGKPVEVVKEKRVSINELIKQRDETLAFNQEQDKKVDNQVKLVDKEHLLLNEIKEIKTKLRQAEGNLEDLQKEMKEFLTSPARIKKLTEKIDKKISESTAINSLADDYEKYLEHQKEYNSLQKEYKELDSQIINLREEKIDAFTKIETGIEGLEVRENGLYYNNIFSENWSDSEGISLSCMLAQIMEPQLKSIFIDRGESFDNKTLAKIEGWANKNDIQCIMTKVEDMVEDENIPEGVYYIENGIVY